MMTARLHQTRMTGVFSRSVDPTRTLRSLLSASFATSVKAAHAGPACFAVAESARASVWQDSHLIVALDGMLYDPQPSAGQSDAEAFASIYRSKGFVEAMRAVNGDTAVAAYDAHTGELWIGRDRLGIRPLYYASGTGTFAFASRPRPLTSMVRNGAQPNPLTIALVAGSHYRFFDHQRHDSPYDGVQQVPAGHVVRIAGEQVDVQEYWTLTDVGDLAGSEGELAEQYRELLLDAVRIRLRRAGRAAFTLSGGMDSSSVLASAGRVAGTPQTAYSTVYDDPTYDESGDIREGLHGLTSDWRPLPVRDPDVFNLVERMVAAHDEPVATATWLSHFLLCEEAERSGFTSLFGGLGGDELNAGEYEHFLYFFADLRTAGDEVTLSREIAKWIEYHDHPIYRKTPAVVERNLARFVDLSVPGRCRVDVGRMTRYGSALSRPYFETLSAFEPDMSGPFSSYLKNRTWQDMIRETLPCCLRAEDRNAAAFGLDSVVPFLDHRLVEFMFRVPGTMKTRDGVTKQLLRAAMKGILPEETRTRIKKTGWNAPAQVWFSGAGRDALLDLVGSQQFRERGIYNADEVVRLIHEHDQIVSSGEARENHMMFLWQLVNIEFWHRAIASQPVTIQ